MATLHKFVTFGTGPNGIQWRWVNYYSTEASFTPTQAEMVAWITAAWATISGTTTSDFKIYAIGYSPYTAAGPTTDPRGWGATVVYPVSLQGLGSGDVLPTQSAYVVLGRTATKRVIAKKFVPGCAENGQNAGVPTAPTLTALANLGGFMYASTYSMGGTALQPGAWGVKHGFTPTISTSVSQYIGSQRRRKPGIGI